MIKSFSFIPAAIFIVLIIISNTIGASDEIPLPDAGDIKKYVIENSYRFNQKKSLFEKEFSADHIFPQPLYSFFKSYNIFGVRSNSSRCLDNWVIGSNASYGCFASNGNDILYLSRSNLDNIGTLLKNEKIHINEMDANIFCDFLSLTFLKYRYNTYKVISSISDITDQVTTDPSCSPVNQFRSDLSVYFECLYGYEINESEINKIESLIHPPKISGNKIFGWKVEFYSWGGSLHEVTDVSRHVFKISGKYTIQYTEEPLTTQVFSKIPPVMY